MLGVQKLQLEDGGDVAREVRIHECWLLRVVIVSSWFVLDCPSPAQAGRRPTGLWDAGLLTYR